MQRVWSTYLGEGEYGQDKPSRFPPAASALLTPDLPLGCTSSALSCSDSMVVGQDREAHLKPSVATLTSLAYSESPSGASRTLSMPPSTMDTPTTSSLSVNFVPTKFPSPVSARGIYRRKGKGDLLKQGGGREAFKTGEQRMPGVADEGYDGVDIDGKSWKSAMPLRWNWFKWTLFCTNLLVTTYSLVTLVACLLVWLDVWNSSDVIRVGDRTLLVLSTVASSTGIVTSLIGWAGIMLNNRGFLAVYTFLLWATFALICAPGYVAYKTRTFNLEGKVNAQWSQLLGQSGRLRIQNQLGCCGYYSPFVEASASQLCYARSVLPGCKDPYLKFQRVTLERWYGIAFGLVPFHLLAILAALLCSNQVTYRFGKGMMPKAYRLSMNSMAAIMDNHATQIAEKYGKDAASELLVRSVSSLLHEDPGKQASGNKRAPISPGQVLR